MNSKKISSALFLVYSLTLCAFGIIGTAFADEGTEPSQQEKVSSPVPNPLEKPEHSSCFSLRIWELVPSEEGINFSQEEQKNAWDISLANSPNPFNANTIVSIKVPRGTSLELRLVIYSLLGKKIETLFEGKVYENISLRWEPGKNGREVSSGMYVAVLSSQERILGATRMLLIK